MIKQQQQRTGWLRILTVIIKSTVEQIHDEILGSRLISLPVTTLPGVAPNVV